MSSSLETTILLRTTGAGICEASSNSAHEQEVNDLSQFLKIEYEKYKQYKILYETLQECIHTDSGLSENLKSKVLYIMLHNSCVQTVLDTSTKDAVMLLGVDKRNNVELSYSEGRELQFVVKRYLESKFERLLTEFQKATKRSVYDIKNKKDTSVFVIKSGDILLIENKMKLSTEQENYIKNLLHMSRLLETISTLRLHKLPEITKQKTKEYCLNSRMNYIKSQLVHDKTRVDIFMENSNSLNAYKKLICDINEHQMECHRDIDELQELRERYKQVTCKEYDDILKSYLQYKSSLEKKKLLYDYLKQDK